MKTIKRTQMESFEGETLKELEQNFNRIMEWVAQTADNYQEPVVDIAALRGYVIFTEVKRIPENIRDQLDLAGERVTCEQCRHFQEGKYNTGACQNVRGTLRKNDECCVKFFKAWAAGDCWLSDGEEGERLNDRIKQSGYPVIRCGA